MIIISCLTKVILGVNKYNWFFYVCRRVVEMMEKLLFPESKGDTSFAWYPANIKAGCQAVFPAD